LICHQWTLGPLPLSDPRRRASLMSTSKREADRLWLEIESEFTQQPDGRWVHARTAADYAEATQVSSKRAAAGSRGAESRWPKAPEAKADSHTKPMANAIGPPDGICHPPVDGKPIANAIFNDGNCHPVAIVLPMASKRDQSTDLSTGKREIPVQDLPQKPAKQASSFLAQRPYAVNRPRNPSAFYESPVFDIPDKWAQQALRASNGRLTAQDLTRFARQLSDRVQAQNEDVSARGNLLAWLDKELHQWRVTQTDSVRQAAQEVTANLHLEKVKRMEAGVYGD
jgi:hypothetical protein